MSMLPVLEYFAGLGLMGLGYWLFDGIKTEIQTASAVTDVYTLANYAWAGMLLIYLLFGGIWLIRRYAEKNGGI